MAISAVGGDVSGNLPTLTVTKIQGTPVSATAPGANNFFKYNGVNWLGSAITVGDLKSTALGNLFPGTGCALNQTLYYSVIGDAFSCVDIGSLDASKITTGTIDAARLPFLADQIHTATSKTTPVAADEIGVADSESSFSLKKFTWANIISTLRSIFSPNVVGEVKIFAGISAPSGWMLCQGQLLNIADYPETYAAIGTTYGGNGTTTFALPDLRGRMLLGTSGSHAIGTTGGAESTTLAAANMPQHTHTATFTGTTDPAGAPSAKLKISNEPANASEGIQDGYLAMGASDGNAQPFLYRETLGGSGSVDLNAGAVTISGGSPGITGGTIAVDNAGTGTAVTTVSPYLSVNYIMYLGGG